MGYFYVFMCEALFRRPGLQGCLPRSYMTLKSPWLVEVFRVLFGQNLACSKSSLRHVGKGTWLQNPPRTVPGTQQALTRCSAKAEVLVLGEEFRLSGAALRLPFLPLRVPQPDSHLLSPARAAVLRRHPHSSRPHALLHSVLHRAIPKPHLTSSLLYLESLSLLPTFSRNCSQPAE